MDSTFAVLGGGFLGFLASILPSFFNALSEYFTNQHNISIAAHTVDAASKGLSLTVETPITPADTSEPEEPIPSFFDHLFDILRSSVRPVITYSFFAIFVYVKLTAMWQAYYVDHTLAVTLLPILWDDGTQTLFAAIVAFWFGSRAFEKQQADPLPKPTTTVTRVSAGDNP